MYFIADNVIFGSATVLKACTVLLVNHKRALGISSSFDQNGLSFVILGKTRLFRRNVAPFLDHRLLNLPRIGPRSCADLLRSILNHCLCFVIALLLSLLEATACRSAELPWLLGTSCDGSVLLHRLFGDSTDLLWPLGAFSVSCVSRGLIFALLFNLSFALNNIILNLMYLLGPLG